MRSVVLILTAVALVVDAQLQTLAGAYPPVLTPDGSYTVMANASLVVLPQACTYYPTGLATNQTTFNFTMLLNNTELIVERVALRTTSHTQKGYKEFVPKICSTYLNAPKIVRGAGLFDLSIESSVPPNPPVVVGPFTTYGAYPPTMIAPNTYMLPAQFTFNTTTPKEYNSGIFMVPGTLITFTILPGTFCAVTGFTLTEDSELIFQVKPADAAHSCAMVQGINFALGVVVV